MNAAVFIDRDNTIIQNDGDLGDPDKVVLMQGAAAAIASLCGLGYRVIVVTNQGGVARGCYTEEDVKAVHRRIEELVASKANGAAIDAFYYCPYHPQAKVEQYRGDPDTRKPGPGMLVQAAKDFNLDLSQCWMVGDQMRDIEAGLAAGCRAILLKPDAAKLTPLRADEQSRRHHDAKSDAPKQVVPEFFAPTLIEAVRVIAQQRRPDSGEGGSARSKERRWDAAAVARLQQRREQPENPAVAEQSEELEPSVKDAEQEKFYRPKGPVKPFRPWGAPDPDAQPQEPIARKRKKPTAAEVDAEEQPASAPSPAVSTHEPAPPQASERPEPQAAQVRASAARSVPASQPAAPVSPPMSDNVPAQKLLQQILSELRTQRGAAGEMSYLTILAIVLQGIAAFCLVAAIWLGVARPELFMQWILAGIMLQISTVAMLLFGRHFH